MYEIYIIHYILLFKLIDEELNITDETRDLGLVVLRGTAIMTVSPDELVEISNPFVKA